jgi:hypothetical protein
MASWEKIMPQASCVSRQLLDPSIQLNSGAPPIDLPSGYVGPAWLPGTGRMIWWTGRVAIGLRHLSSAPTRSVRSGTELCAGVDTQLNWRPAAA